MMKSFFKEIGSICQRYPLSLFNKHRLESEVLCLRRYDFEKVGALSKQEFYVLYKISGNMLWLNVDLRQEIE